MNRRMLLDSIYDWRPMQVGMVSAWSSWRLANTNPNYANLLPVLDTMIGPAVIYEFYAWNNIVGSYCNLLPLKIHWFLSLTAIFEQIFGVIESKFEDYSGF